jgi:ATP-dependent Clp protease ATP-binding subunit ClpB
VDASKLTSRSVEVVNAASTLAVNEGNPQVDPVHLAVALLRQEQGITPSLLAKTGADVAEVSHALDQALRNLPQASGSTVQTPSPSAGFTRVLAKALDLIKDMGDEYVATEHLLLALAIVDSRGDVRGAGEVRRRPHPGGRGRQARPGDRARRRDPPGGAGAVATDQEQPGADR